MAVKRVIDHDFLNDSFKSRSFGDALSGLPSSGFPDLRQCSFRGLPFLWISENEILALATPFQYALVSFFPLCRLSVDAIRKFFFNLKLHADFSVTVLDQSHILIKLSNDLDYSRIFCHRSYLVNNYFMKITKWSPSLDISIESPMIPILVSFPNLRPHLFSPRILHSLGSMFGRPLKVDSATSVGSRPSLARVLVELDITKNFPDKIRLGPDKLGYIQSVEMEVFPAFCDQCKAIGHKRGECRTVSPNPVSVPIIAANPLRSVETDAVENVTGVSNGCDDSCHEVLCIAGNGVNSVANVDGLAESTLGACDGKPSPIPLVMNAEQVSGLDGGNLEVCELTNSNLIVIVAPVSLPVLSSHAVSLGCAVSETALSHGDPIFPPVSFSVLIASVLGEVAKLAINLSLPIPSSIPFVVPTVDPVEAPNLLVNAEQASVLVEDNLEVSVVDAPVPVPNLSTTAVGFGDAKLVVISTPCDPISYPDDPGSIAVTISGDSTVGVCEAVLGVVDIPISVVSNKELKSHVAWSLNNSVLLQTNWLEMDGSDLTPSVGKCDDLAVHVNDDMYNFMVGCVVDQAVLYGGGKMKKSKAKKK
ncbi:hypothetical protein M5K25_002408 [Dendrobium thyrsiflorum]|uniref:DUF4283 domain-containing protein n=1 Tax=Dendrobium thyrsiflorum TaxID=117978 RepID=A0ABD0VNI0_DENTH